MDADTRMICSMCGWGYRVGLWEGAAPPHAVGTIPACPGVGKRGRMDTEPMPRTRRDLLEAKTMAQFRARQRLRREAARQRTRGRG